MSMFRPACSSILRPAGLLAFSLMGLTLAGCNPQARYQSTVALNVAADAAAPVEVSTRNGAVTIEADAGSDVRIVAKVRAITQERADAVRIDAQRDSEGALIVAALWPDDIQHSNEACSFDIRLPGARGAQVRTSNGAVRLVGLAGSARIETSNGAITVDRQGGDVTATSSNGAITITDAAGAIDLHTSNGRIQVSGATGQVACRTSNGAVRIDMAPDAPGPVTVDSSNGTIDLVFGRGFTGSIQASTSNGKVRISPKVQNASINARGAAASLELTSSGPVSTLHTSNASITVTQGD